MTQSPYLSLYRRYRPQKFSDVRGQEHVVRALTNALREKRVGHAYLFSGPRGTGKTSVARILAKALNCEHAENGEPDDTCDSCIRIREGNSLDVHELDAASNNGVEAMRELVSRAALGTPGRWKVYIVDEVHMLSTAASNALLKTLEEPPAHVVFVLATTDPQKVLPTIRSRTQHFEFRLLSNELLAQLVTQINQDAGLAVSEDAILHVVRRGRGSARDALSVLDQVAAAGIIDDEGEILDEIVESICEKDTARAFTALAKACNAGRDPQRMSVDLLEYLRNCFLSLMARSLVSLPDEAIDRVEEQARRLGAARTVRAMELIGETLRDMRDAPDARVALEVSLVRLTNSLHDDEISDLRNRVERLERMLDHQSPSHARDKEIVQRSQDANPSTEVSGTASSLRRTISTQPSVATTQSVQARSSLGGLRRGAAHESTKVPEKPSVSEEQDASGAFPTRDQLVQDWGDTLLEKLSQKARSRFRLGCFVKVTPSAVQFALPNSVHRARCEEVRLDVEAVLREHYKVRIPLELVIDKAADPNSSASEIMHREDDVIDLRETTIDEIVTTQTPTDRLLKAFPGAEISTSNDSSGQ